MTTNLLLKFKWYIIGFILIAIMLSVSLSFASWDTKSLKATLTNANSGWYTQTPTKYKLVKDNNSNSIADVGDIVSFGNYYQQANAVNKSPINWIVAHKKNNELTLLSEKIIAFGNFWGVNYHDGTQWVWGNTSNGTYYQNYSKSTLRAWLNSYYIGENARNDAGEPFTKNCSQPRFRGFMSEAFSVDEQNYIISKRISGIKGLKKDALKDTTLEDYASVIDKVWVPSWSEIYGTRETEWGETIDGDIATTEKLQYFTLFGQEASKAVATDFAIIPSISNYAHQDTAHIENSQLLTNNSYGWWWLRSPRPNYYYDVLVIFGEARALTAHAQGGVRPAIIVPF